MAIKNNATVNGTKFVVNTRYGRLEDGRIVYATRPIQYQGRTIVCNANATAVYLKYGFKEIIVGEYPDFPVEGFDVIETYTEDDSKIYVNYEVIINE